VTATTTGNAVDDSRTFADLVERLGGIALDRIRMHPLPGTATIDDLVRVNDGKRDVPCELIDGVLVEKAPMSSLEDSLTTVLACYLHLFLQRTRLGKGFTAGAIYRLTPEQGRLPDFTVCLNDKFPSGKVERVPYVDFAPDLAVEVLSKSNTLAEIAEKRRELFEAGTQLMWIVDPGSRTIDVLTSADDAVTLTEDDVLTGGDLLPGFELSINEWFREAEEV
jgi:Uma2 family endonuclease